MLEKNININWLNINYKDFWEKSTETILILHGWWWSSDSWVQVWEFIWNSWFKVIIPDLPWFWKTTLENTFTLDNYAKVIEDFVNTLWLWEITLLWHSNWWAISIKIENRKNIKIKKLILNNSAWIRNKKSNNLKKKVIWLIIKPFKFIKNLPFWYKIKNLFYRFIWWHDYINSEKNLFLKETYLNMIKSDLQDEIKSIKTSTLLIRWDKDTYTPLEDWKLMNKNIVNSKLVILDWEKHGIHLQNPNRLVKVILENV